MIIFHYFKFYLSFQILKFKIPLIIYYIHQHLNIQINHKYIYLYYKYYIQNF